MATFLRQAATALDKVTVRPQPSPGFAPAAPQTFMPHPNVGQAATSNFQKPETVTFTFNSERFNRSGNLIDQDGRVVYEFTEGLHGQPLVVNRSYDRAVVGRIHWGDGRSLENVFVDGLGGLVYARKIHGDLMDKNLCWTLSDGSKFEWDGMIGVAPVNLLDYRIPQPFSLVPATVAIWTPKGFQGSRQSKVQVHKQALSVPGFFEHIIVTLLFLEYMTFLNSGAMNPQQPSYPPAPPPSSQKPSYLPGPTPPQQPSYLPAPSPPINGAMNSQQAGYPSAPPPRDTSETGGGLAEQAGAFGAGLVQAIGGFGAGVAQQVGSLGPEGQQQFTDALVYLAS
ncbi:hypothetical protein DL96DRAFT_1605887, partial [Flagelloscypha sp. PMI_526]